MIICKEPVKALSVALIQKVMNVLMPEATTFTTLTYALDLKDYRINFMGEGEAYSIHVFIKGMSAVVYHTLVKEHALYEKVEEDCRNIARCVVKISKGGEKVAK